MAGLYLAFGVESGWASHCRDTALRRMLHYPWLRAHTFEEGKFAVALVLPGDVPPPVWNRTKAGDFVAVFGEYYPHDRPVSDADQEAQRIAYCAANGNESALRNQNGIYNLLHWRGSCECLTLANDGTGALLLFRQRQREGVVWTSEPGLLWPSEEVDRAALVSLVLRGYVCGDATPDATVTVLPPACTERCAGSGGALRLSTEQGIALDRGADFSSTYGTALREAVTLRANDGRPIALPLTAGLDSRMLLAELLSVLPCAAAPSRIQTFTVPAGQKRDPEIAAMLAGKVGVAHRTVPLESHAITRHRSLLEAALATTTDWHPAAQLGICGTGHRGSALWLGYLGGTLGGARVHRHVDAAQQLVPGVPGTDPVPEFAANLWGRQRRYTSYLVRLAWNFAKPVCPFADRRLLHLALNARRACLQMQSARRAWFQREHPRFAEIAGNDGHPYAGSAGSRFRALLRSTGVGRLLGHRRRMFIQGYETEFLTNTAAELWNLLPGEQEFSNRNALEKLALGPLLLLGSEALARAAREVARKEQNSHADIH